MPKTTGEDFHNMMLGLKHSLSHSLYEIMGQLQLIAPQETGRALRVFGEMLGSV